MPQRDVPETVEVLVGESPYLVFHLPHSEHTLESACANPLAGAERKRRGECDNYTLCQYCAGTVNRDAGLRAHLLETEPEDLGLDPIPESESNGRV